jgi:hypothetical protein
MVVENVTEQMPRAFVARTLHQVVRRMRERSVSFAVRAHSQEIIGRRGSFTATAKNRSYALALTVSYTKDDNLRF